MFFFSSVAAVKTSARNKKKSDQVYAIVCAFVLHKILRRINIWYIDICTYDNLAIGNFSKDLFRNADDEACFAQ